MAWLVLTVLVSLVLLTVVLLTPIRLRLLLTPGRNRVSFHYLGFEIAWDQGARRPDLCFFGLRLGARANRDLTAPEAAVRPPSARVNEAAEAHGAERRIFRRVRLLWSARTALRRTTVVIGRLLGRLWRSWRLESGRVHLAFGFADPALTGFTTGLFWALRPAIRQRWPMLAIDCSPSFTPGEGATFRAEVVLVHRIVPIVPFWAVVRASSTLPWRSLVRLRRAWVL